LRDHLIDQLADAEFIEHTRTKPRCSNVSLLYISVSLMAQSMTHR